MTCLNVNCAEIIGHVQTAIYQNIRTCGFWCKNFFSKLANYIDNWQSKYYIILDTTVLTKCRFTEAGRTHQDYTSECHNLVTNKIIPTHKIKHLSYVQQIAAY